MDPVNNQVVEFIENQRFICAVCIGQKGARFHLVTYTGREINLSRSRLIHSSGQVISWHNRDQVVSELSEINNRRNKLAEIPDLLELWELIVDEQVSWTVNDLTALAFTGEDLTPDHEAALIRSVINEHLHFKFREGRILVQSRETVEQLLIQQEKEKEKEKRLKIGIDWLKNLWQGSSPEACKDDQDLINSFWIEALKAYCVDGDNSKQSVLVKQLFRDAGIKDPSAPFKTLVRAGVWSEDENLEILKFGISRDFSDEVLKQAEEISKSKVSTNNRVDLTNLEIFTIDAPDSQDLDDALSLEVLDGGAWRIGIHITDVGLKIPCGTPLFEEAVSRATTIYLPEEKISMLPEILSEGALSLKAGEPRDAVSFLITLDEKGHVLKHEILRSKIKVSKRLCYSEVDELIERGEGDIGTLFNLCKALKAQRIESGALPLPIPELLITVDNSGLVHVELCNPGPARFLVAECMILANTTAASFLKEREIPGLFRSQPEPRERIITGEDTDLFSNLRQRRLISRGHLGPEAEFHHGLGLTAYTTVTSPLRRALDLLMQQQITHFLKTGQRLYSNEDLEQHLILLEQGLHTAAAIKQNRTRYWLLKYIAGKKDEVLKALIIEVGQRRIQAVLTDYLINVELPRLPGKDYSLGQEIEIRAKKVDPRENILKMDWV